VQPRSRREEYSEATRTALVAAARANFAAHGYADASIEMIAREARVTRGALYHHFAGKRALFEEVVRAVQGDAAARVNAAAVLKTGPWDRLEAGLGEFLSISHEPEYRRVVLEDALSVLGSLRWREIDDEYMLAGTTAAITALARAGELPPDNLDLVTHLLIGAVTEAGLVVAASETPSETAAAATGLLIRFLRGAAK
jgi:AcrR family transcriptional regulator